MKAPKSFLKKCYAVGRPAMVEMIGKATDGVGIKIVEAYSNYEIAMVLWALVCIAKSKVPVG